MKQFKMNVYNRLLTTRTEEVFMHRLHKNRGTSRAVRLMEDIIIPANSEVVVPATCGGKNGVTVLIESMKNCKLYGQGILPAKTPSTQKKSTIFGSNDESQRI